MPRIKGPSEELKRAVKRDKRQQRRLRRQKTAEKFDWSKVNVLPQSFDRADYPYRASTKLVRENENPPVTCGKCIIWRATIDGKRRWVFAFDRRSLRDEFLREGKSINGRKIRKEPNQL